MPRKPLSPAERRLRALLAVHTSWENTRDPAARTAPARRAFLAKFESQVDPNNELDPAERARRARSAMRAHMAGLALRSSRARKSGETPPGDGAVA